MFTRRCESTARLIGQTAIITGANTGIGQQTAKDFYKRGANVLILCRDEEKSKIAITEIKEQCADLKDVGSLRFKYIDLGILSSIRKCAEEILQEEEQINLLINNAGVYCPLDRYTVDGFETHFGVNHLGHFLLTLLLLPKIIQSAPSRIVNVASLIANWPFVGGRIYFDDLKFEKQRYSQTRAYAQSKLANIIFAKELSRKLKDAGVKNVTVYSLHPGVIASGIGRNFDSYLPGLTWLWDKLTPYLSLSTEMGAQTTIYCALDEKLANESGLYYSNCRLTQPVSIAFDQEIGRKLWEISIKLLNLENYNPFQQTMNQHKML